ncbi:MAG: putative rane protein [Acidimicrobiaceae bacterium]
MAIVGVCVLAGCDAPTRPEHRERITNLDFFATAQADGDVAVKLTIEFPSDDGGTLRLAAPTLGTISDVRLDGSPRSASGETVDVDPNERAATVEWIVHGAIERYPDGAIVTLPVWTPSPGLNGDDKRVPISIAMHVPAPALGQARWHGATPNGFGAEGSLILYGGEIATTTPSWLTFLLPSDALPGAPVLPGASRVASYEDRQASADASDARIVSDLANDRRREDLEANLYWGAVGLEIAIPFLITLIALLRTAAVRRRATRDVPDELPDAPSDLSPAVVALLHADAKDIGAGAIAATILDLVQRRALTIEGVSGERYKLAVTGSASRPGEAAVLATLGPAPVEGPPLPISRQGEWWRMLRRDVVTIAREAGLVRRRYPSGLFLTAVVALAITTIPLYARSPEALVAGVVVASILAAIPFIGGFVLTAAGHRERARWEAYRRHLAAADLGDVPAPGVIVWESALVYAAALGIATAAIKDLS